MKSRGETASGTLKLRPSPWKWAGIGLVFLALAAGMALLYAASPQEDSSGESLLLVGSLVGFFGLGAVASFWMLHPNSAYLLLMPDGFEIRTLFKRKDYRWDDVESFQATTLRGTPWVFFTLSAQRKTGLNESRLRSLNKAIGGSDDNLPDTYGLTPENLAELMNQWKRSSKGAVE